MLNLSCSICSELFVPADVVHAISCGHIFHNHCLEQWLQRSNTCPQCRRQCTNSDTFRIYFNLENSNNTSIESLQMEIVNKTAMLENNEKTIGDLLKAVEQKDSYLKSYSQEKNEKVLKLGKTILNLQNLMKERNSRIKSYSVEVENKGKNINNLQKKIKSLQKIIEKMTSLKSDELKKNEKKIKDLETKITEKDVLILNYSLELKDDKELLDKQIKIVQEFENRILKKKSLIDDYLNQVVNKNLKLKKNGETLQTVLILLDAQAKKIEDLEQLLNSSRIKTINVNRELTESADLRKEIQIWKQKAKNYEISLESQNNEIKHLDIELGHIQNNYHILFMQKNELEWRLNEMENQKSQKPQKRKFRTVTTIGLLVFGIYVYNKFLK